MKNTKEINKEIQILRNLGLPESDIEYIRNIREKEIVSERWN